MHDLDLAWLAWCGTYLLHSTVVLGAAWALTRYLRPGAQVRDALWKCALVLPFVTAGLQVALPERSLAPRVELRAPAASTPRVPLDARAAALGAAAPSIDRTELAAPASSGGTTDAESGTPFSSAPLILLIVALWGAFILLIPELRLAWMLRDRKAAEDPAALALFRGLRGRAGLRRSVRLSVSGRIATPIAYGVLFPEVCLPARALELPAPMLRALLAHELAHHARLDPVWTRVAHAVVALGWIQPLHRVARRELGRAAELLADDLAVAWTEDRAGLASCLVEITGWLQPGGHRGAPPASVAVAMVRANRTSSLRQRVERALDGPCEGRARFALLAAAVCGGLVALGAPGIARATVDDGERALSALADELNAVRADLLVLGLHPDASVRAEAETAELRTLLLQQRRTELERLLRSASAD